MIRVDSICLYLNASVHNRALKFARSFFQTVLDPKVMRLWQDRRCFSFWISFKVKIPALAIDIVSTALHSRLWTLFELNINVPIIWKAPEVVIRVVPGYKIMFCFVYKLAGSPKLVAIVTRAVNDLPLATSVSMGSCRNLHKVQYANSFMPSFSLPY